MRNRTIISNSDNACNVCVVCVMNGIQDSAYSVNGGDDGYNNDDDGPRTVGANGWKFEKKMRKSWRRGVRQLNERDFVKRTTRCTISSIRSDPRGVWRRLWCSEDEWHIVKNVHNSICSCNPLFFASFSLVQRFTWLAGWLLLPSLSRIQTSACWRDFEHRHTHTIFIFITFSFCRLHCALSIALLHVFLFCWLVCVPLQSGIVQWSESHIHYGLRKRNGVFFFALSPHLSECLTEYTVVLHADVCIGERSWYVNFFSRSFREPEPSASNELYALCAKTRCTSQPEIIVKKAFTQIR